jgi:hypothetical protein
MTRESAREVIAFWVYRMRMDNAKRCDMPAYGNETTDRECAERVLCFFDALKKGEETRDWSFQHLYDDYKQFLPVYEAIDEDTM